MDDAGPRYALYFAPDPAGELWRFGSACLGYDAATGQPCAPLAVEAFAPEAWLRMTEEPRRYGFHATLKAPFHLGEGYAEADVIRAVDEFAASQDSIVLPRLHVALLSRFVALVPEAPSAPLQELAARAVRALEPLRAPLSEADIARRLQSPLSERQADQLRRWGYPYVFEDFRFHMTLTGPLDDATRAPTLAELARLYRAHVKQAPVAINAVTLFRQERRDAPFRIIRRALLRCPSSAGSPE